jgi:cytosine/adenosine deaminase-related metal-dependent hydrolase
MMTSSHYRLAEIDREGWRVDRAMSSRILIKGGYVLSMDRETGELEQGSVLVEGNTIVEVAPHIDAPDAEVIDASDAVVMPGFVDTHRHTWQSLLRGLYCDTNIIEFLGSLRNRVTSKYTAEDAYIGNLVGALEAIDSGVTTFIDYSHCIHSPEHGDALIRGLQEAGVRAVYAYGYGGSSLVTEPGAHGFRSFEERVADSRRIAETYLSADDGLLTRGIAITETAIAPFSRTMDEIRAADELDATIITHTGAMWGSACTNGVRELHYHGLLHEKQVHVHCCSLTDEHFRMLADAGAKVSIAPETEMGMGMGRPPIRKCIEHGIKPTLSVDVASFNSGDLLSQLRTALLFQRAMDHDVHFSYDQMPLKVELKVRDALEWGTLNGAAACGLADKVGSLAPGKRADIILIGGLSPNMIPRPDMVGSIVLQANAANVRTVLVDGRVLKRDGVLVGVDLRRIREMATSAQVALFERVNDGGEVLPEIGQEWLDRMNGIWAENLAESGLPNKWQGRSASASGAGVR